MRKLSSLAVATTAAAALLVPSALASATHTVTVGDNYFVKANTKPTIHVARGTKVTFRWTGKVLHDVHGYRGPAKFRSRLKSSGTYSRTLTASGTYLLRCDVHPSQMRLTIKVG